jgi:hypothetical protein
MPQSDFDQIIKPYVPPQWDNPYYYLFPSFMAAASSLEKHGGRNRPIEFIFDSSERFEKPSLRLYHHLPSIHELFGNITNVHYEDEKLFLPLQAADLLAWQIRRRFCVTSEPPRPQFEKAINNPRLPPFLKALTREDLELLGQRMEDDAKQKWRELGLPEDARPWKRSAKEGREI